MTTHPTTTELVDAVTAFLETAVAPQLKDRDAFLARVAVNALAVIRREFDGAAELDRITAEGRTAVLGAGLADAADLCRAIRDEIVGRDTPGLLDQLRRETIARLRIDQPSYAGLRTALEAAPPPGPHGP